MKTKFLSFILIAAILCACSTESDVNQSESDNKQTVDPANVTVNTDEEVITCFNLTNAFRTGSEAFYLNEDNMTTTSLVGQLSALTLDADLCKAATIRSQEIISSFSHTRPGGTSCFTVLDDLSISYTAVGENIAAGNQSGEQTFLQWKEDEKDYAGQGHRRNMLGTNFTKIGIAYVHDANSKYGYYWTMILAK